LGKLYTGIGILTIRFAPLQSAQLRALDEKHSHLFGKGRVRVKLGVLPSAALGSSLKN
jgi:hypothetical protein